MVKNNKESTIETLKSFGRLPTSKIAAIVGMNTNRAREVLEELLKEKRVIKYEETLATYWESYGRSNETTPKKVKK